MLLAFLIYLIQFIGQIKILFIVLSVAAAVFMIANGIWWATEADYHRDTTVPKKNCKKFFYLGLIGVVIALALPNERTSYLMAAGYTAQTIAESPASKEIGGKVLTIINQKLDNMVDEGVKAAQETAEAAAKKAVKKVADEVTK